MFLEVKNFLKYVFFQTLGCKVNQYESEAMQKLFEAAGWQIAEKISEAEVVVVNTCTVTAVSSQKSRQMIRRAAKKNCVLVVVGCYAQSEPEEIAKIDGVDVIIGTKDRTRIVELVEAAIKNREKILQVGAVEEIRDFEELPHTPHRTRAFLKIEDGCNNFCSYCIIPYVRGRVRSRKLESIRAESLQLKAAGYKEIVLTGIHIGAYGRDLSEKISLVDAIKTVLDAANPLRLRLGSLESAEMTDELIDLLKSDGRICNHVHLPLQSGSDEILRAMRRPYTTKNFAELTARLVEEIPEISIGTDLIVGFPNETPENFSETLEFIREQPFSKIHVFPYSARAGTLAATLPNQISPQIKKSRANLALEVSRAKQKIFSERLIGKTVEIIAETSTDGIVDGLTKNYVRVYAPEKNIQLGGVMKVNVEKLFKDGVIGSAKKFFPNE
ncbi:MAG: tRNA (N(6)-L-threonylcarbamoyladenosine(37)-C(2))-methylthiotransferase MtaB [Quinella sp. 3Q1]|nr:tRNA (N(6)-L-threonylcarbamoyladenosine(37)-C(2))-methylthiotransferase MtaB [Quinella sp. 3Q1]MBR3051235.1 tRNA (N(6)-L-threonylcarbamoyladenosine(37)-C(2))-methylthiotransferase MtaB [Selenomonadaceae bacterium]MBR6889143.1 tRNA (N(6)-L-threonylcarbamoyladenosine(37)-C(2))-methylthiotransferase MtaB [Selenomonadaceae bacterium]